MIPVTHVLTPENFWDDLKKETKGRLQYFFKWVDEYKGAIGWDNIFGKDLKFHQLPTAMQIGVIFQYFGSCGYVAIDFELVDMEGWVKDIREALLEDACVQRCKVCGCTQDDCRQCVEAQGYPCSWAETDLCSRCVPVVQDTKKKGAPSGSPGKSIKSLLEGRGL